MPRSLKKQVSIFPNLHLTTSIFNSNSRQGHENTRTIILYCELFCRFLKVSREETNKEMLLLEEKTTRKGKMWGLHVAKLNY